MIKMIRKLKNSKSGASAAEYALLIALVGGLIITAATALSGGISTVFNTTASTLNTAARCRAVSVDVVRAC